MPRSLSRLAATPVAVAALAAILGGAAVCGTAAPAPAPAAARASISVGAPLRKEPIPADFIGLSFEISNLRPDKDGRCMLTGDNSEVIALARAAGIKNLRIGGGSMEHDSYVAPTRAEIDRLFAFAGAIDARVIYSFPLLKANRETEAACVATAKYIWERYQSRLDSFSLGNEPDWRSYHTYEGHVVDPEIVQTVAGRPGTAFPSYFAKWRAFAGALARAIPGARLSGPDTGSNYPVPGADIGAEGMRVESWATDTGFSGMSWTEAFARATRDFGNVAAILPHDYTGQGAAGKNVARATEQMLSKLWVDVNYEVFHSRVLARVQALGLPYRITECNDHTGGVDGASNAFVSALWVLDYAHWHAEHGAIGLNFHNRRRIKTETITFDESTKTYRLNPKACGMRAFSLGAAGRAAVAGVMNPENVNMTAYAVTGGADTFVTIINKEHGAGARDVTVTINAAPAAGAAFRAAASMALAAPANNPNARAGITLGGSEIGADGSWNGAWTPQKIDASGKCTITVPATSAVVIKFSTLVQPVRPNTPNTPGTP